MAKKIMIGLPVYAQMFSQFAISLIYALRKAPPHTIVLKERIGESLIPRGRNTIAHQFLNSDCSHLLFLDSDLQFTSETFSRLINHDHDIICGIYPKKQVTTSYVVNNVYERDGDMWSVREAGTGAMMISRNVFERMMAMRDEEGIGGWYVDQATIHQEPEVKYDFFRTGNFNIGKANDKNVYWQKDDLPETMQYLAGEEKKWYLSEDWYFCQRWKQMGGDIWLDSGCVFNHVGQQTFPIHYSELKEAIEVLEKGAEMNGVSLDEL